MNITDGHFMVTTTADSGPGSLRQAILDANATHGPEPDTIAFAIPGPGVQTIAPLSALPAITRPVLIDGLSQPGYAGTPLIELSGRQAGGGDGLTITGSDVTVRGLDINGFLGRRHSHHRTAATGNTIAANVIGTDPTGTQALPNGFGVQILPAPATTWWAGRRRRRQPDRLQAGRASTSRATAPSATGSPATGSSPTTTSPTPTPRGAPVRRLELRQPAQGLISGFAQSETIEAWFRTTSGGVILGYQSASPGAYPTTDMSRCSMSAPTASSTAGL